MISQIFILSFRGEVLVYENFRHDVKSTPAKFYAIVKEAKGNCLDPIIVRDGIKYSHIVRDNLYFVATSIAHTGIAVAGLAYPIMVTEVLKRFCGLCKDFCGIVSEDSVRANVLLIHEILEQFMDSGYVQLSRTDKLKPGIMSEAKCFKPQKELLHSGFAETKLLPSSFSNKPIVVSPVHQQNRENQIFVDVIEKLAAIVNADGSVSRSEVTGEIQMKCYLSGQVTLKFGLNEGLVVDDGNDAGFGAVAHVSDCHFHDSVSLEDFHSKRILTLHPPEGQFAVLVYNVVKNFPNALPFNLVHTVDQIAESNDLDITLKLKCNIPSSTEALKICAHFPVPKSTTNFMQKCNGPWQFAKFDSKEKKIIWDIKKLPGGSEAIGRFRLLNGNMQRNCSCELGPLVLAEFEISSYVCSNVNIRFINVLNDGQNMNPRMWVRYVTVSNSYVFKLSD